MCNLDLKEISKLATFCAIYIGFHLGSIISSAIFGNLC